MTKVAKLPSSTLDWALMYAKNGWRVFPLLPMHEGACSCSEGASCTRPGKHPALKSWQKEASTDADRIKEWWGKFPKSGIGIATGKESNLTILDVDAGGDVTLNKLRGKEAMPDTAVVETGSGGRHFYFAYTAAVKTVAKKIGAGLDTRSDGGYVVAPPSDHASGSKYKWLGKWNTTPAQFPEWLTVEEEKGEAGRGRPRRESLNAENPREVERLKNALQFIDCENYDRWVRVGLILGRAFQWNTEGEKLFLDWAAQAGARYDHKGSRKLYHEESRKKTNGKVLTTASIFEWAEENPAYVPLSRNVPRDFTVVDNADDIEKIIDGIEEAVSQIENMFARNFELVRVAMARELDEASGRDADAPILIPYTQLTLAAALSQKLSYIVENEDGKSKRVEIPAKRVQTLLERKHWLRVRELKGFVRHPIFDSNRDLITEQGYHAESRVYITSKVNITAPKATTGTAARSMLQRIMDPLQDFAWATPLDRSVFLAAFFTAGMRYRFATAPLFGFSSNTPGSGKGLLTDVIGIIWQNSTPSKIAWSPSFEEMEKRIGAYLRSGDPLICFDNIEKNARLHDPTLCGVLTSATWDFRVLGLTEKVKLLTNSTFFATGNNLTVTGDTARRVLVCRIDPEVEDPSQRTNFKIPHLAKWMHEHREQMLSSACYVLKAYMDSGPSKSRWTMGSFEDWATFMDGLMIYLGEEPLSSYSMRDSFYDAESADAERDFLSALSRLAFEEDGKQYSTPELTQKILASSELVQDFKMAYSQIMHSQTRSSYGMHDPNVDVNISTVGVLMKALAGQFRQIDFDNPMMVRILQTINRKTKAKKWCLDTRPVPPVK